MPPGKRELANVLPEAAIMTKFPRDAKSAPTSSSHLLMSAVTRKTTASDQRMKTRAAQEREKHDTNEFSRKNFES
jgi:hypothetical protein